MSTPRDGRELCYKGISMSELIKYTSEGCQDLTELPTDLRLEEAVIIAGTLHGLFHDELVRIGEEHPAESANYGARLLRNDALNRAMTIYDCAVRLTLLVGYAVSSQFELEGLLCTSGITEDPRVTVDLTSPMRCMYPSNWA
jgi:hypothetical protein